MSNKNLSVIVPVYKVEPYICQSLDSIVNQTYRNLEIILVDDGSPDRCGEICDEYAKKDARIKVIHKENGGLVSARKAGVKVAGGDYIAFVDSDDWIDIEAYEKGMSIMESYNPEMLIFGYKKIYSNAVRMEEDFLEEGFYTRNFLYEKICEIDKNDIFYQKLVTPFCWNKIVKRELIERNIPFVDNAIRTGEDAALMYPTLMNVKSIYILHDNFYNYRMSDSSMVHEHKSDNYRTVFRVKKRVREALESAGLLSNEILFNQYKLYVASLIMISDPTYFFNDIRDIYPKLEEKTKILIYGKGVYASYLEELIKRSGEMKMVGKIDSSSLDELENYEYDYIIIGVVIASFVRDIIVNLKNKNVDQSKIVYLTNRGILDNEKILKLIRD